MKTQIHASLVCVALLGAFNPPLTAFAQGSLTPPGAPAPTMKSLSQVEPRIPVDSLPGDSQSVFIISQPGSYYLTTNITITGATNALRIVTNDVEIDLGGFTIYGPGSRAAIRAFGPNLDRVRIRNGHISGWGSGIDFITAGKATNAVMEDLQINLVPASFTFGIGCDDGARISRCSVSGAMGDSSAGIEIGAHGVLESCEIANCSAGVLAGSQCDIRNNIVRNCTGAGSDGINVGRSSAIQNNLVDGCTGGIETDDDCIVTGNRVLNSTTGNGFDISGSGSRLEDNLVSGNANSGFQTQGGTNNLIIKNFARGNRGGNYSLDTNQVVGPIIFTVGTITPTPMANFSY